jgi:ATP adenylyltransferase
MDEPLIRSSAHRACKVQFDSTQLSRCERCSCSLCTEFAGTSIPLHTVMMPRTAKTRVLWEDDDWLIIPTIGPLIPGHVMLVPREHHFSILSCPSEILAEGQWLLERCSLKLRHLYQQAIVVFEHGMTANQRKTCGACIEHAHLHVAPGSPSFVSSLTLNSRGWHSAASFSALVSPIGNSPYIMVGLAQPDTRFWARQCVDSVPSQFLRRVFAEQLGKDGDWDWRKNPNPNAFLETINDWKRDAQFP